jgi:hypothetical protein
VTTVTNAVNESGTRTTLLTRLICRVHMSSSVFDMDRCVINSLQESQAGCAIGCSRPRPGCIT